MSKKVIKSTSEERQTLMGRLTKAVRDSIGGDIELHEKSMFGGICLWVDGPPKTGFLIGGVTSKLQICVRTSVDLQSEMSAYGAKSMMGAHMPFDVIEESTFFADSKRMKKWIHKIVDAARTKASVKKRPRDMANKSTSPVKKRSKTKQRTPEKNAAKPKKKTSVRKSSRRDLNKTKNSKSTENPPTKHVRSSPKPRKVSTKKKTATPSKKTKN